MAAPRVGFCAAFESFLGGFTTMNRDVMSMASSSSAFDVGHVRRAWLQLFGQTADEAVPGMPTNEQFDQLMVSRCVLDHCARPKSKPDAHLTTGAERRPSAPC